MPRRASSSTLRVRFVQATADTGRPVERAEFQDVVARFGGDLWAPGRFGQSVRDGYAIGCWHWKGDFYDTCVSMLWFANGRCKISLGTGAWTPLEWFRDNDDDPWVLVCGLISEQMLGRMTVDWTVHVMSADKRWAHGLKLEPLVQLFRAEPEFASVLEPHVMPQGRLGALRAYRADGSVIIIDHKGNVQWTGFRSWCDLASMVAYVDRVARALDSTLLHDVVYQE